MANSSYKHTAILDTNLPCQVSCFILESPIFMFFTHDKFIIQNMAIL